MIYDYFSYQQEMFMALGLEQAKRAAEKEKAKEEKSQKENSKDK